MRIGFAVCASFCTHRKMLHVLEELSRNNDVVPILSESCISNDTRFGLARDICKKIEQICGRKIIWNIVDAEPLGPTEALDALIICPCTGNTLAKIANGITDTSVTMAAKAHLRSDRPLLAALATNDAMSANLKNIASLLQRKNVYFVPMKQDSPESKPHSLVADFDLVLPCLELAIQGKQKRPLFLE